MPDCFISHAHADATFARHIHDILSLHGLSSFLAPLSLRPGDDWSHAVRANLVSSRWVLFLASRAACDSPYVQQEIGGALFGDKVIVPIVWDMRPEDLPGWANRHQAIDLRRMPPEEVAMQVSRVAASIRASRDKGVAIAIGLLGGLLLLAACGDEGTVSSERDP